MRVRKASQNLDWSQASSPHLPPFTEDSYQSSILVDRVVTMLALRVCLLATLTVDAMCLSSSGETEVDHGLANPIRKVVSMLQGIQKKVEEHGEEQKKLYEKFMCFCKNNRGVLQASIESSETKVPQLTSAIGSLQEQNAQLEEDVKQHQADLAAAMAAIDKATSIREKEATAFKAAAAEAGVNLEAVNKAVAALIKGMGKSFLQSSSAKRVQQTVLSSTDMSNDDRQEILVFLAGTSASGDDPSSGEIVGILKELAATMDKSIGKAARAEEAASKAYEELTRAKKKEIDTLKTTIRTKSQRISDRAVEIVQKQDDLDDAQTALTQDRQFAAKLQTNCATKDAEYNKESQAMQQELLALADTIKILASDKARDLFEKTLPGQSSSFVQFGVIGMKLREQALGLLHKIRSGVPGSHTGLDLIVLALHGNKIGFDAVIAKIDALLVELRKAQDDDVKKKVYCAGQFDSVLDKSKDLQRSISDIDSALASNAEDLAASAEDLAQLDAHIKDLDKSVVEATEQRKAEHSAFLEDMADNTAARQLLAFAKQRLQKFYGSALAQASSTNENFAAEASEELESYKKSQAAIGVIAVIDKLIADIEVDMAAAEAEEKDAQSDYETAQKSAKEKRQQDVKFLTAKESEKSELNSVYVTREGEKRQKSAELMTHGELLASVHKACDWLLQNFDARQTARASEMDALKNAKNVLAGGRASLL